MRSAQRLLSILRQRHQGAGRDSQQQHIACEARHLRQENSGDFVARRRQRIMHRPPLGRIADAFEANDREAHAHAHHHVSVIDGLPPRIEGVKSDGAIAKPRQACIKPCRGPLGRRLRIG